MIVSFVQFCANKPETFVQAAKYAEPYCDAIDLNLGCPQSIAKKGMKLSNRFFHRYFSKSFYAVVFSIFGSDAILLACVCMGLCKV